MKKYIVFFFKGRAEIFPGVWYKKYSLKILKIQDLKLRSLELALHYSSSSIHSTNSSLYSGSKSFSLKLKLLNTNIKYKY